MVRSKIFQGFLDLEFGFPFEDVVVGLPPLKRSAVVVREYRTAPRPAIRALSAIFQPLARLIPVVTRSMFVAHNFLQLNRNRLSFPRVGRTLPEYKMRVLSGQDGSVGISASSSRFFFTACAPMMSFNHSNVCPELVEIASKIAVPFAIPSYS